MFSSQEAVHAVTDRRVTALMLLYNVNIDCSLYGPVNVRPFPFVDNVKRIISRVPVDDSGATPLYLYLVTICHVT